MIASQKLLETVGSQFLPRGINLSRRALWEDTRCSRAGKRDGFKRGVLLIWTCPSFCVLFVLLSQATKRSTKIITFWVRRPPGGVGVFHAKGWWPKSSCYPSKVCLGFRNLGCPRNFARMSRIVGVFKKFVQKSSRTCLFPIIFWTFTIFRNFPDFSGDLRDLSFSSLSAC